MIEEENYKKIQYRINEVEEEIRRLGTILKIVMLILGILSNIVISVVLSKW